eukprot:TRINITY_DN7111_c0_g1_i1.p1 TRINITY_DN7111_c0_g1~~TRINITY_DN7111_c0_g1_i1.p1  ORF type:complete len:58 (-),score=13.05 TRINITY_DN7111_c0_g1_i1:51-224(-)
MMDDGESPISFVDRRNLSVRITQWMDNVKQDYESIHVQSEGKKLVKELMNLDLKKSP